MSKRSNECQCFIKSFIPQWNQYNVLTAYSIWQGCGPQWLSHSLSSHLMSTSSYATANKKMWEGWLHHPLTWSLVFDEEKLQTLLEGIFIHIKLYLHPDRGERKRNISHKDQPQKQPHRCFWRQFCMEFYTVLIFMLFFW